MKGGICQVEGCAAPVRCRGLCARHYERLRQHGDPTIMRTHRNAGKSCLVSGCAEVEWRRGYCSRHYRRWRLYGDPTGAPKTRPVPICTVGGCEREVKSHGL